MKRVRGMGSCAHSTHHTEVKRVSIRPLLLVFIKQTAEADVGHQDEDRNDFSTDLWTDKPSATVHSLTVSMPRARLCSRADEEAHTNICCDGTAILYGDMIYMVSVSKRAREGVLAAAPPNNNIKTPKITRAVGWGSRKGCIRFQRSIDTATENFTTHLFLLQRTIIMDELVQPLWTVHMRLECLSV